MTAFTEYTADEILTEVLAYGFWWIDEDEDVQDIEHETVIFADGRRAKLTGTACRNAWDAFASANPNACWSSRSRRGATISTPK